MSQKRDGLYLEKEQSFLALGTFSKLKKLAKPHYLPAFALVLCQQSALGPLRSPARYHLRPSHFQLRLFVCVHKAYSTVPQV